MVVVGSDANPRDEPADAAALVEHAAALLAAIDEALPQWVERSVIERWRAWSGQPPTPDLAARASAAGLAAHGDAMSRLRALLEADVEQQRTNPLSVLRGVTRHATEALAAAGVPPVVRDPHAEHLFPDDTYDLGPAAFADLGADVHDSGLVWGAAKAHVVMARHRRTAPGG